jgi:hypothetical protein
VRTCFVRRICNHLLLSIYVTYYYYYYYYYYYKNKKTMKLDDNLINLKRALSRILESYKTDDEPS